MSICSSQITKRRCCLLQYVVRMVRMEWIVKNVLEVVQSRAMAMVNVWSVQTDYFPDLLMTIFEAWELSVLLWHVLLYMILSLINFLAGWHNRCLNQVFSSLLLEINAAKSIFAAEILPKCVSGRGSL